MNLSERFGNLWGTGLEYKHYWGYRLRLRRNSNVYDIELGVRNIRLTLLIYRKKV